MTLSGDEFLRLESLIYRPVSTRPDWLKAWRNEANYLLYLAHRASAADDIELILHSRADDVVPFGHSVELISMSHLPETALITVGHDHRLADPERLPAILLSGPILTAARPRTGPASRTRRASCR